jgi:DNA-binding NtrC family response regulator
MSLRVLVIDNDVARRSLLRNALFRRFTVVESATAEGAVSAVRSEGVDAVVVGAVGRGTLDAVELTPRLREGRAGVTVFLIARDTSEEIAIAALRAHVDDYFRPPLDVGALIAALERCCAPNAVARKTADSQAPPLIGQSAVVENLREYMIKVAASDCNVLITGETGTGKEVVARFLHCNSARRHRTLTCVNCAAIPDLLLESELFGYERGAFTGATTARDGKAQLSDGGTLFFDEIGEMSAQGQAKILRMIENGEVQKLGARAAAPVDVRIIAATNQDLEQKVREQCFRADLYFRLNVARIRLPPLRERKDDVVRLAQHFIRDLNTRTHLAVEGLTGAATDILIRYDWPGNVRELRNVVEAAFINRPSSRIDVRDLPALLHAPREERVEPLERERYLTAMQQAHGNKSLAAKLLNCSRMTLYRKLEQFGDGSPVTPRDSRDTGATVE